jgi:hypothetical protein
VNRPGHWQITAKTRAALTFQDRSGDVGCQPGRGVFQLLEAALYKVYKSLDLLLDASEGLTHTGTAAAAPTPHSPLLGDDDVRLES